MSPSSSGMSYSVKSRDALEVDVGESGFEGFGSDCIDVFLVWDGSVESQVLMDGGLEN
jgi:hypothetical protein